MAGEKDNFKLSGVVLEAISGDDVNYLILSVFIPTHCDVERRTKIKIPIRDDAIYKKYKDIIENPKQKEVEKYVTISGNLEIKVQEVPPF